MTRTRTRHMNPITTLLIKDEEDKDPEIQARRRKAMFAADARARREQEELRKRGVCPKCHTYLTLTGKCGYGHIF